MDFQQFRDIHHLIPQVLDIRARDYPQIEDSDKWEIYVKYRKIVSRFLTHSETWPRPGIYPRSIYRDSNQSPIDLFRWSSGQEQYVSLAEYLINFLSGDL